MRIRPLRPSSSPPRRAHRDARPARGHAGRGHRCSRTRGHAARGIRPRTEPGAERSARARRGRGHQPHRCQDPLGLGRVGGDRFVSRGARLRLQRCRRALAVRVARLPAGHGGLRDAALPPHPGLLRRVRRRAHALARPQALVALARRSGGRAAGGAHRVGSRRRDGPRARGPADPDPRRQRRSRALRRAARRVLRRARDGHRLRPATPRGFGSSAPRPSSTTLRAASRRSSPRSMSSSTSSATRTMRPARAR